MSDTVEEYEVLLRGALKQPGVKELMEVYGQYEEHVRQINDYRKAFAPRLAVWTSDHTE